MRRIIALTALLLCVFCTVCSAQEAGFSCEYTPKSERSSTFYIDILCEREISAAVFSLDYDGGFVSFRSAQAAESSTTLRSTDNGGRVNVALADSAAVSGRLCRLYFTASAEGTTSFVLRVSQTADASMKKSDSSEEYTLSVTFDKDDVVKSDASSKTSKSSSKTSSKTSSAYRSGSRSSRSDVWGDEGEDMGSVYYDLRPDNTWKYILIGAGSALVIAAGAFAAAYMLKKKAKDDGAKPEPVIDSEKQALIEELNEEIAGDPDDE